MFTRSATLLRMERSSPWSPATRATRCGSVLRLSPSPTSTTWTSALWGDLERLRTCAGWASGDRHLIMENGLRHLESTQTGTMVPTHRAVYAYALAHEGHFERAAHEAALVRRRCAGHRAIFLDGLPVLAWRLFATVDERSRRRSRGGLHGSAGPCASAAGDIGALRRYEPGAVMGRQWQAWRSCSPFSRR